MLSLTLETQGQKSETRSLDHGACRLGSGPDDELKVDGLPAGAVLLEVTAAGLLVTPAVDGVRFAERPLKPTERRLLLDGQSIAIGEATLKVSVPKAERGDGTEGLARGLLAEALDAEAPGTLPTLVWLNGKDCGHTVTITEEALFVGRGDGCRARVRDPLASRQHARLILKGGKATLIDLGSQNGLRVDGVKVTEPVRLYGGELIEIGTTDLGFVASLPKDPVAPQPAPEAANVPAEEPAPAPRKRLTALEVAMIASGTAVGAAGIASAWLLLR